MQEAVPQVVLKPNGSPDGLSRRRLLIGSLGVAMAGVPGVAVSGSVTSFSVLWDDFRRRFVSSDGRVIDTGNGGITHSEGQGYGLLLAARANDADTFRRIRAFTRHALQIRGDALHAWRFDPRLVTPVTDRNNATDGDWAIAWGLLTGALRWHDSELAAEAQAIVRDIFRVTGREFAGRYIVLPGAIGFEGRGFVIENPSYAMFPAWSVLRHIFPHAPWRRLEHDALAMLAHGRFGARRLPPDWLQIDRTTRSYSMPDRWPKRFSYDAIRVPLFLTWGGHVDHVAYRSVIDFWRQRPPQATPAWVDLVSDQVAHYRASPGMLAIRALAMRDRSLLATASAIPGGDYYSSALRLLALLAAEDRQYL